MTSNEQAQERPDAHICPLIEDLLPLYLEGEASPASSALVVQHLAHCERCAGFLAGSQSVRAQLRREAAQRVQVVAARVPEQRVVAMGQVLATLLAVLLGCAIGSVGSFGFWQGVRYATPGTLALGTTMVAGGFFLLLGLARSRGPLTLERVLLLAGGCCLGALAVLVVLMGRGDIPVLPLGGLVGLAALLGVWAAVWQTQPLPRRSALAAAGGMVLLAFSLLITLPPIHIGGPWNIHWGPLSAIALVGCGLLLLNRSH